MMKKQLLMLLLIIIATIGSSQSKIRVSKQALWYYLIELEIKHPDLVFAQAILESGNFKSKVFQNNNNLFGMKIPSRRKTVGQKKNSTYLYYESWKQSVQDYKLYQNYMFRNGSYSREQYIKMLEQRYAKTPGYTATLLRIIENNSSVFF